MANMTTVDGVNHAQNGEQWVLVYSDTVKYAQCCSGQVSSKHNMEVFATEAEMLTRMNVLGFEMPEEYNV